MLSWWDGAKLTGGQRGGTLSPGGAAGGPGTEGRVDVSHGVWPTLSGPRTRTWTKGEVVQEIKNFPTGRAGLIQKGLLPILQGGPRGSVAVSSSDLRGGGVAGWGGVSLGDKSLLIKSPH